MKRIYIVIAWILGICCTIFSIILLMVAPLGTALFAIAFFAFFMIGLILSIRRLSTQQDKQDKRNSSTPPLIQLQLQPGNGIQLLESIQIIATTHNVQTLDSRIKYIIPLYERFLANSRFEIYDDIVGMAIEQYRMKYPDRTLTNNQLLLIKVPDRNDLLSFISQSISGSYTRYVRLQQEQINGLVRQSAKEKRYTTIKVQREEFLALYERYAIPKQDNWSLIEELNYIP